MEVAPHDIGLWDADVAQDGKAVLVPDAADREELRQRLERDACVPRLMSRALLPLAGVRVHQIRVHVGDDRVASQRPLDPPREPDQQLAVEHAGPIREIGAVEQEALDNAAQRASAGAHVHPPGLRFLGW